jgi:hypothetical protein
MALTHEPPPALRAGNQLPLAALSMPRRVMATSMRRPSPAQNDSLLRGNENAWTELAAEVSLQPISCFAVKWRLRSRLLVGQCHPT